MAGTGNSYWTGGWADGSPNFMRGMPGTIGAQMNGGNYGPVQALADILGAYWQKQAYEGAIGYASSPEMKQGLDKMTEPVYEKVDMPPEQYGDKEMQGAVQSMQVGGQLPNPDWLHKNTPAFELTPIQKMASGSQSLIQAATDLANTAQQPSAATKAKLQSQYDEFAKNQKEHPEWFAGNTYTGGDEKARVKANLDYAQGRAEADNAYSARTGRFKTGLEQYGYTGKARAASFQEVKERAADLKAKAMQAALRRYGVRGAQMAEGLIDSAIQDRLNAFGGATMAQARVPIDKFLAQNADNLNDPKVFMQAGRMMTDYNIAAKQMGQPEFDTSLLTQLQKMGEVSVTKSNQGGYTSWVAVKKNGGSFGVDKDGKPVYAVPIMKEAKTPTWKEQQDVDLKKAGLIENIRTHKANEGLKARDLDEKHRHNVVTENKPTRSGGGSSKSGGGSGGANFNSKKVESKVTDMLAQGQTPSQVKEQLLNAGMSEEQADAYLPPSAIEYYHNVWGDDAPE
ncbi:hypothetical protein [Mitsuokella sp. AF21-1AC]|uniref:hypothetical protein n=1 Tax=Mitsuokella sp. AF21-1AC TaxID=2292235 RepID=UPI000E54FB7F|nr:hypothetical protein [Mitsuokella sp. AF21-1AC]RGS72003.1 hypothetical protein DWX75_07345 [Mitsuokella sp. AF21-1AC]